MQFRFHFLVAVLCVCCFLALFVLAQSEPPKYEIGLHAASLAPVGFESGGVGGGLRFTYNFNAMLAVEGEVNVFNRTSFDSINRVQGLAGLKSGVRFDKVGLFGKIRPGVAHNVFTSVKNAPCHTFVAPPNSPLPGCTFGRTARNDFALDLGGVVEFYPARRWVMRFDVGDTIIRRSLPNVTIDGSGIGNLLLLAPDQHIVRHNLQINAGVGFRF